MATIFISYKRGTELDEPLAGELYRRLSAAGHRVFRDQDSLIVGQPWAKAIQAHLETCDYLVLLLSAAAAASEMVAEEVRLARRRWWPSDLQRFSDATRADPDTLLREFCAEIEYQMKLPPSVDAFWESNARRDAGALPLLPVLPLSPGTTGWVC